MAWIILTEEDLQGRLTGPELTALKSVALASGKTAAEVLAQAIEDATKRVRGYVAACAKNSLGEPATTIPDELKSAALALVRNYLFTRLPGMKSLNDETRQQEQRDALRELQDTAACKFAIVPPADVSADQAGGTAIEEVSSRTRVAKRADLDGLM